MTRASQRARREAEGRFPVRVRIAVPAHGFGQLLAVMHGWLDETCGAAGWASAPSGIEGVVNDAVAFYFADASFAQAFVTRFCCGYRIETVAGSFTLRDDRPAPRLGAAFHKTP